MVLHATLKVSVTYRLYYELQAFLSVFSDIPHGCVILVLFGTYSIINHLFTWLSILVPSVNLHIRGGSFTVLQYYKWERIHTYTHMHACVCMGVQIIYSIEHNIYAHDTQNYLAALDVTTYSNSHKLHRKTGNLQAYGEHIVLGCLVATVIKLTRHSFNIVVSTIIITTISPLL